MIITLLQSVKLAKNFFLFFWWSVCVNNYSEIKNVVQHVSQLLRSEYNNQFVLL